MLSTEYNFRRPPLWPPVTQSYCAVFAGVKTFEIGLRFSPSNFLFDYFHRIHILHSWCGRWFGLWAQLLMHIGFARNWLESFDGTKMRVPNFLGRISTWRESSKIEMHSVFVAHGQMEKIQLKRFFFVRLFVPRFISDGFSCGVIDKWAKKCFCSCSIVFAHQCCNI